MQECGPNCKNTIMRMYLRWLKLQLISSILTKSVEQAILETVMVTLLLQIMILLEGNKARRESLIDIVYDDRLIDRYILICFNN